MGTVDPRSALLDTPLPGPRRSAGGGPHADGQDGEATRGLVAAGRSRRLALALGATVGLYLLLAFAVALTKLPWVDEAWFAIPAWNLVAHGHMGTTNLETAGTSLRGVDRYTYWIMPLHVLAQAAWYRLFGFGLLPMRALSILWGLVALASWYVIVKAFSGRPAVPVLAVLFTASDFIFVRGASDGRMDMMNAALGFAGLATYVCYRERDFNRAVLLSHGLVAASALTHPNGIFAFGGLVAFTLYLDRNRVRWAHVLLAAVPYVVGLAAWGLYILKDPGLFLMQFGANAGTRWSGAASLSLISHVWDMYGPGFGLQAHWAGAMVHLKALVLIAYLVGAAGVLLTPGLRRQRGYRALLILTAVYFVLMSLFWSPNAHDYLIHIVPMYAALLAAWLEWCWRRRPIPRRLVATAACGLLLLQVGGIVARVAFNPYRSDYMPVIEFLRHTASPGSLIMGSAELGFQLGFDRPLIDDVRLGYYSGKHPDFIVIEERYRGWFRGFVARAPEVNRHVTEMLTNTYAPVYNHGSYVVYAKRRQDATPIPKSTAGMSLEHLGRS